MRTSWGEDSGPHWTEYPRPQLVRARWHNLNGPWQYALRPRPEPMPTDWDGMINVPFCIESELSGVGRRLQPQERLWYQRTLPALAAGQRTLLHFGAVDYAAAVWLNGALVGSHSGGFDAFQLDLTEFLRADANELIVAVDDPTSSAEQPRGKQHLTPQGIWYTPVSGIWQTVWLEQVPLANHIEEVRIRPDAAGGCIDVDVLLARPTRSPELAVDIRITLQGAPVAQVVARANRRVRLPIANAQLWSPDTPVLYDVDVRLVTVASPFPDGGDGSRSNSLQREVALHGAAEAQLYAGIEPPAEALDTVGSYFGMRSIELGAHPASGQPTLLLNGAPLFHLGTLDQGWWPDGLHTPPADAAMVYEIEFLKAAGFNTVRKHIKVEPARYYYHCDRLGLLVWQDMPSGFLPAQFIAPNDAGEGLRHSRSAAQYELELHHMLQQLRAHPSIVVWVLHNEGWGQFDSAALVTRIRSIDPTRLVNATSGWLDTGAGDFIDAHDYAGEPAAPTADGKRAVVIGEYGGIGWPIEGHLWNPAMRNWGYQTLHAESDVRAAYARATAALVAQQHSAGLCAAIYTQTSDVEGEVNGLLSYDRRVEKLSREFLAASHQPLFE